MTTLYPVEITGEQNFGEGQDQHSGNGDQKVDVAVVFEMYEMVRNEAAIA